MTKLLVLATVLEAATGLALMIDPSLVVRLLLGEVVSGPGMALGRITGIALLSLGLACWPGAKASGCPLPWPVLTYNTLVASYLFSLGLGGERVGVLLWPAVAVHGFLALLLIGAWFRARQATTS
jgi:hypothetical protein